MKRQRLSSKQDQEIKILSPDSKIAEQYDQNIVYPDNQFASKKFSSWRHFYDVLNADKQITKNWFRLTESASTDKYTIRCTLCSSFIEIKVKKESRKLECIQVVKMNNIHNHNGSSDQDKEDRKKQQISKKWTQLNQIFLEKSQNFPMGTLEGYLKKFSDLLLPSQQDDCKILLKCWKQKKQLKSYIKYKIFINTSQYHQQTHKFSLLPQKQIDLLSICIVLSECFLLGLKNVSIVCGWELADNLNSKGWRQQLIFNKLDQPLKRKWRIIKKLQQFFGEVIYESTQKDNQDKKMISLNKSADEIDFSLQ